MPSKICIDVGGRAFGATCSGDWIAIVNRLAPLFGNVVRKAVVYGGDVTQGRSGFDFLSWREI